MFVAAVLSRDFVMFVAEAVGFVERFCNVCSCGFVERFCNVCS